MVADISDAEVPAFFNTNVMDSGRGKDRYRPSDECIEKADKNATNTRVAPRGFVPDAVIRLHQGFFYCICQSDV